MPCIKYAKATYSICAQLCSQRDLKSSYEKLTSGVENSGFKTKCWFESMSPGLKGKSAIRIHREYLGNVALEPRGTLHQNAQHNLSFRVEKSFIFETGKLGLIFDVLNATNSGTVTHVQSLRLDSPNFMLPEVTVLPFTARLGIRFSF